MKKLGVGLAVLAVAAILAGTIYNTIELWKVKEDVGVTLDNQSQAQPRTGADYQNKLLATIFTCLYQSQGAAPRSVESNLTTPPKMMMSNDDVAGELVGDPENNANDPAAEAQKAGDKYAPFTGGVVSSGPFIDDGKTLYESIRGEKRTCTLKR